MPKEMTKKERRWVRVTGKLEGGGSKVVLSRLFRPCSEQFAKLSAVRPHHYAPVLAARVLAGLALYPI